LILGEIWSNRAKEGDMYIITGASGHTGRVAAERLLAAGAKVRVLGRDAKRLEQLAQKGAEVAVTDMTDAVAVKKAFSGGRAAHILIPPNPTASDVRAYQELVNDNIAAAIRENGISYATVVSSTGADQSYGTGPVVGLYSLEQKLWAIDGLNVVSLRCGYFMENTLPQIGVIQAMGFIAGPLRDDVAVPMIYTRDIGEVSGELLAKLDFSGKQTRELLGPRHIAYPEAAKIIGAAIGKPDLAYKQVPGAVLRAPMMQMGMSSNMVDLMLEMFDALNTGLMKSREPRSPQNTTPTTLETFVAEVFAPAYRAKAAGA
jgi:uncharacterized protein YbjT (DUF2867 family)